MGCSEQGSHKSQWSANACGSNECVNAARGRDRSDDRKSAEKAPLRGATLRALATPVPTGAVPPARPRLLAPLSLPQPSPHRPPTASALSRAHSPPARSSRRIAKACRRSFYPHARRASAPFAVRARLGPGLCAGARAAGFLAGGPHPPAPLPGRASPPPRPRPRRDKAPARAWLALLLARVCVGSQLP